MIIVEGRHDVRGAMSGETPRGVPPPGAPLSAKLGAQSMKPDRHDFALILVMEAFARSLPKRRRAAYFDDLEAQLALQEQIARQNVPRIGSALSPGAHDQLCFETIDVMKPVVRAMRRRNRW